jgi:hypothetical protein
MLSDKETAKRLADLGRLARHCALCPRRCGVDRTGEARGYCGAGTEAVIASAGPHFGEEACLVGRGGSGTIFMAGCNLGCVFCQNHDISRAAASPNWPAFRGRRRWPRSATTPAAWACVSTATRRWRPRRRAVAVFHGTFKGLSFRASEASREISPCGQWCGYQGEISFGFAQDRLSTSPASRASLEMTGIGACHVRQSPPPLPSPIPQRRAFFV